MRPFVLILVIAVGANALAQAPAFEAASVKRRTEPGGGFVGRQPGGRFTAQGASLQDLIVFAYDLQPYQIVDGPRWMNTERWDVTASGATGTPADVLRALQQLLADRFLLVVRREMRELPVYAVVLARSDGRPGPQLKRSEIDCDAVQAQAMKTGVIPPNAKQLCIAEGRIGSIRIGGAPLSVFATMVSTRLQRAVVDRTGLTGPWDLTLTYTPEPSQIAQGALSPGDQPAFDPSGPSIFTAVQEQLGLKLDSTRAPVDVLVIARAEFATDN